MHVSMLYERLVSKQTDTRFNVVKCWEETYVWESFASVGLESFLFANEAVFALAEAP